MNANPHPPRWADRFLAWYCSERFLEEIQGDLYEQFALDLEARGLKPARWRFIIQVFRFFRIFRLRRFEEFEYLFIPTGMWKNYIKIAWRNMRRQKVYAFINIFGLALGMAACILIMLFVRDELSYDRYHEKEDRIQRLSREWLNEDGESSLHLGHAAPPFVPLLAEDFKGIIEEAVRFRRRQPLITYEDKQFEEENFFFVDSNVFRVFSWEMLEGDAERVLAVPNQLVMTRSAARRYFGEEDPIGKVVNYNNMVDMQVAGLLEDIPANSHFKFDILASFITFENYVGKENLMRNWGSNNYASYLLLKEGYEAKDLEKQLPEFLDRHLESYKGIKSSTYNRLHLMPLADIHLYSHLDSEVEENSDISFVYIFTIIALFILIIACANFINLMTAQSARRAREVGLRKVIGAQRSSLIWQFISESVLVALLALGVGVILVKLALPFFNDFSAKMLTLNLADGGFTILLLLGVATASGLLAGSYPALYLSGFEPVKVLRSAGARKSGRSRLRSVLVVMQFAISIALIIGVGVVLSQLAYVKNKSTGFDQKDLMVLEASDELYNAYSSVKDRLLQHPGIEAVSIASLVPSWRLLDSQGWAAEVADGIMDGSFRIADIHVGHDFFKTYNVRFKAGRNFDVQLATDSSDAFILNEMAVQKIGWQAPEAAIGKEFRYGGRKGKVVGVIEDFHFESLHQPIVPVAFMITQGRYNVVTARINGAARSEVVSYLEEEWKSLRPGFPFEYEYIEDMYAEQYADEDRFAKVIGFFSLLAVLIAALGLFGLASFTAEARFKEIAIRKVMGATTGDILMLLGSGFTRLVLVAFIVACPLAWYFMDRWLDGFAYHTAIRLWPFLLAGLVAFLIAWFTIFWKSYRAATANPAEAIQYE